MLPEIVSALRETGLAVLRAPTGAGKTTRVPLALLRSGLLDDGIALLLEPRRVAARAAARFMSSELGETVGTTVGWQVRFDRRASASTRILVVTEGLLVRRLLSDPFLEGVSTVLFDEVHERHLDTDLGLAMVRHIRDTLRPDLRIVLMSATLGAERLGAALDAPIIESEGRSYPLTIRYEDPGSTPLEDAMARAIRRAREATRGRVLAFLPGVREIERTASRLGRDAVPLHGRLSIEAQDRVLRADGGPVVLATNVAESSVTLAGVTAVVDSGLERRLSYDLRRGMNRLETVPIGQSSADQRAGRAGREGPGLAIRLWSELTHARRPHRADPEIRRLDLASAVLAIQAWGAEPEELPWLDPPSAARLQEARDLLTELGATDPNGLTPLGERLAQLPLHPRLGVVLDRGWAGGHVTTAPLAAAWLSEQRGGLSRGRPSTSSDVRDAIEDPHPAVRRVAQQLTRAARRHLGPSGRESISLEHAIYLGFRDRLAHRREPGSDRLVLTGRRGARQDPASAVRDGDWLVALDVDLGPSGEARVRVASAVEPSWLPRRQEVRVHWDGERVRATRCELVGDLVLSEHPTGDAPPESVQACLIEAITPSLHRALAIDEGDGRLLLLRLRRLADWLPDLGLPPLDDDALLQLLPQACAGARTLRAVRRQAGEKLLLEQLTWKQRQELERHAPARIEVPSGSRRRVTYSEDGAPVLAVRIQELFGWTETPRIARGRVPLLLHLLAPNGRVQQITEDLGGFWTRTYPEIRRELRARYPKHAWPEDPLTARPERRPRRRR